MRKLLLAGVFASLAFSAQAGIVTPDDASWSNPADQNSLTGKAVITATEAYMGNGSLELFGDRTRFLTGSIYDASSNLGLLSDVTNLTFDWQLATDNVSNLGADATPALRLHLFDGQTRKQLVWEGAYNGTYGSTVEGTWYSTTSSAKFYWNGDNPNDSRTIADWISSGVFGSNVYVSGISVGVGSTAGNGYHAFADNVVYTTKSGSTAWNFETAAVPEPGTWALMITGFGLAGTALRRRKVATVA